MATVSTAQKHALSATLSAITRGHPCSMKPNVAGGKPLVFMIQAAPAAVRTSSVEVVSVLDPPLALNWRSRPSAEVYRNIIKITLVNRVPNATRMRYSSMRSRIDSAATALVRLRPFAEHTGLPLERKRQQIDAGFGLQASQRLQRQRPQPHLRFRSHRGRAQGAAEHTHFPEMRAGLDTAHARAVAALVHRDPPFGQQTQPVGDFAFLQDDRARLVFLEAQKRRQAFDEAFEACRAKSRCRANQHVDPALRSFVERSIRIRHDLADPFRKHDSPPTARSCRGLCSPP